METIIVSPKTKAPFKLLTDLLHELKIPARILTEEEKENIGLGVVNKKKQIKSKRRMPIRSYSQCPDVKNIQGYPIRALV